MKKKKESKGSKKEMTTNDGIDLKKGFRSKPIDKSEVKSEQKVVVPVGKK